MSKFPERTSIDKKEKNPDMQDVHMDDVKGGKEANKSGRTVTEVGGQPAVAQEAKREQCVRTEGGQQRKFCDSEESGIA